MRNRETEEKGGSGRETQGGRLREEGTDGWSLVCARAKQGREVSESVQPRRESGTRLTRFLNLWSMRPFRVTFSLCHFVSLFLSSLCFSIFSSFHLSFFHCLPDEANLTEGDSKRSSFSFPPCVMMGMSRRYWRLFFIVRLFPSRDMHNRCTG